MTPMIEVIDILKSIKNTFETFNYNGEFREELNALTIAIQELDKNERSEEEWLDNFIKKYNESRDFQITDIRDREKLLDDLRPKGEWKVQRLQNGFDDVYCPFCNARPTRSEYGYYLKDKFCHECGADMRKGGDKE